MPGPDQARLVTLPPEERFRFVVRARFVGEYAAMALPKVQETIRTWKPDLVLRDSCEYASLLAAEDAGTPHVRVDVLNPDAEVAFTAAAAEPLDVLRGRAGLPSDGGASLRSGPAYTSFPPSFFDAGARPFFLRGNVGAAAPLAACTAWMQRDDRPLVYITFGTVLGELSGALPVYRAALEAMADLPVRALLTTGAGVDIATFGAVPGNVSVETFVPQAQVFPHAAVALNHGGSGTVLGGLAAGIPMVIAPLFADQPHNARSVERTGSGVAVFKPDAALMHGAVARVLAKAAMRDAAGRMAAEMAALPDVDAAIDTLLALA